MSHRLTYTLYSIMLKSIVFVGTSRPNAIIFIVDHIDEMWIKICKGQAPGVAFISVLL